MSAGGRGAEGRGKAAPNRDVSAGRSRGEEAGGGRDAPAIADASFLIAVANKRDVHHAKAMERFDAGGPLHLHEYVFLETVTVVAARCGHEAAVTFGRYLLEDGRFAWRPSGGPGGPWRVFQAEKGLSLTDAALVAGARKSGMEVVTYDKRLAKAV